MGSVVKCDHAIGDRVVEAYGTNTSPQGRWGVVQEAEDGYDWHCDTCGYDPCTYTIAWIDGAVEKYVSEFRIESAPSEAQE